MGLPRIVRAVDVTVVLLLAASAQVQVWTGSDSSFESGPAAQSALAALITLPLLVRHRYALPVIATVVVAGWLEHELGGGLGQTWLAVVLALYAVAAHAPLRDALLGAGATGVVTLVDGAAKLRAGEPWEDVVPAWFVLVGVWAFGRWMRWRRRELWTLHEQAAASDRDREEAARTAVADERARIARELHDLVAHSVGVIVIQSQAAQRVLLTDPVAAEQALASIEVTGRQGLQEMRRLLGVLVASEPDAPLAPSPSLRHLDALIERVRLAGLPVELSVDGEARPLPPGVDLSAYRIVQEALTNALQHSGAAAVRVHLSYGGDSVEVEVSDDGTAKEPAGTSAGGGHGLVGMRERVTLYGGTLHAGREPDGGYLVRAHLPVDTVDAADRRR